MKPWLLEILACPIDKYYPLDLSIYAIEDLNSFLQKVGNLEEMKKDLSFFFKNNIDDDEPSSNVAIINFDDSSKELLVFDTLVRKPSPAVTYLEKMLASIDELKPIVDYSHAKVKETITTLLALKDKFKKVIDSVTGAGITPARQREAIQAIEPDLILLNWFKQAVEIESGIMTCSKCHRWFPIRDSIPQMLPDELRKEKYDKEFLETWKNRIDTSIVRNGAPFHL
ncbi:MAG: Trm112 family protein [Candidatus Sigynarchaeota archaeon]